MKPIPTIGRRCGVLAPLALAIAVMLLASCSSGIATPANRYAVVVGITDYPGSYNDLNYPDDDASEMSSLLSSRGWTVVTKLLDSAATSDAVATAISDLASSIGTDRNSTVLFYYSGHGDLEDGTAYIVPYDSIDTNGNIIKSSMISASEMSQLLGALECENKLLILDSCYSGGFVGSSSTSSDTSSQNYGYYESGTGEADLLYALSHSSEFIAKNLAENGDPDVLCISAAGSEEMSWDDSDHKNGAFTYYLLASADSGDSNGDGYVSATEAYSYAKAKIKTGWDAEYQSTTSEAYQEYRNYYSRLGYRITSWEDIFEIIGYVPDFLPHISGGTGDLVLYVND